MPNMFVEISSQLAAKKGIKNGDLVEIKTPRSSIKAIACVTNRLKPFPLNGKTVEVIGMPWHWGYQGFARGDSANMLTAHVGDANTSIPEYKAFLCDIRRVG
jgi:formate dehydrogenase major subunit